MKDLTILLTLYDRGGYYEYPKRWTNFANIHLNNFKILIADGTGIKKTEDFFTNKNNFPNLDLSYFKYPKDNSYKDYFSKLDKSISKVKTKYMVLADDDDFYSANGLIKSIDFLEKNNDFSTCRGLIGSFKLSKHKNLSHAFLPKIQNSFSKNKPIDRFKSFYAETNISPIFYDVHKSDLQKKNFKRLNQGNFIEPVMVEMLTEMLDILQGKIGRINELYLMRQLDKNNSAHKQYVDKSGDIMHRLCFGDFTHDLKIWAEIISSEIANNENIPDHESKNLVTTTYKKAIIESLQINKKNKYKIQIFFDSLLRYINKKDIYKEDFIMKINNYLKDFN